MANKLLSLADATTAIQGHQQAGRTVVFTNGCFDIMHAGHVQYLYDANALGDILVVGLNSDHSVQGYKGPKRPIVQQDYRADVMSALEMVDIVVFFDDPTPIPTLEALRPDIHVKGGDYDAESLPEYDTVTGYGGRVAIMPFKPGCSTSQIIDTIVERYSPQI